MNKYIIVIFTFFMLNINCEGPVFDVPADEDSIPPTLTITFPADQSVLSDTVTISAYAFDNVGLEKVYIYLNDSIVLEKQDSEPFEYIWPTIDYAEDQFHTIRAKAIDLSQNENYTNTIQVKVDNQDNVSPTGAIIYPSTGQNLSGIINIILEASDNDSISHLKLFISGDTIATFLTPPYTYQWNTTQETDDLVYTIHAHVVDVSSNQATLGPISVTIDNYEAEDNLGPTGNITSPPASSVVSDIVNVSVDANDNVGMSHVEFIIDGSLENTDYDAPYQYSWDTNLEIEDADHVINVTLFDIAGNSTSLFPVKVFVDNLDNPDITNPSIVIYEPAANQTVSGIITIKPIATDNIGVDRVEYYHNYVMEDTLITDYPYHYTWNTSQYEDSEHIWYAKVYDLSGNESQTQPMTLIVDNIDDIPPTGSFLFPYAGQTVTGEIDIQLDANDNIAVSHVIFYLDGNILSQDYSYPFNHEWDTSVNIEDGIHVIYAIIYDNSGNSTTISSIAVTVDNDAAPDNDYTPPVVSILSPFSGQTVSDTVEIRVFSSDNHEVSELLFSINDSTIASLTDTPYSVLWNTNSLTNFSEHVINVAASDPSNNQSYAQPILVNIFNVQNWVIENLTVSSSENQINLNWDSPSGGSSAYKIYRDSLFISETSQLSFTDTVEPGTEYCYAVSAVNDINQEGPRTDESCIMTELPLAPILSININGSVATLNWTSVSSISQYRIYRDSEFLIELSETSYGTDVGTGVNTCFTITSINSFGAESLNSNEECVTGF